MKIMKKLTALLLAAVLLLCLLTACGEKTDREPEEDTETEEQEERASKKDKKKDREKEKKEEKSGEPPYRTEMEGEADTSVPPVSNEPGETNDPVTPPEPGQPEEPGETAPAVHPAGYELKTSLSSDYSREFATLYAYGSDGTELWNFAFPVAYVTELDPVLDIGLNVNGYYVVCGGILYCINYDGTELWHNADFGGYSAHYAFDDSGCIYLCGFYGPDLCKIDGGGNTLYCHGELPYPDGGHPDNYWPYILTYEDGVIQITFDASGATVTVDPATGIPLP